MPSKFHKKIIDATHHLCVAYKPNIAFYESLGIKGMTSLEKTLENDLNNNFRKVDLWADKIGCSYIEKDIKKENEFLNINTKEDLELAEKMYNKK